MNNLNAPWSSEEYYEHAGYDAIYGGITVVDAQGKTIVIVDGCHFEQKSCEPATDDCLKRMKLVADLIKIAPEMFAVLEFIVAEWRKGTYGPEWFLKNSGAVEVLEKNRRSRSDEKTILPHS